VYLKISILSVFLKQLSCFRGRRSVFADNSRVLFYTINCDKTNPCSKGKEHLENIPSNDNEDKKHLRIECLRKQQLQRVNNESEEQRNT
jgi:hypothetical protein